MIKITNKEREYLVKKGVPCGENGISRSLKNKYYLCESDENLLVLDQYRNSITKFSATK